jgi:hypothetical protein
VNSSEETPAAGDPDNGLSEDLAESERPTSLDDVDKSAVSRVIARADLKNVRLRALNASSIATELTTDWPNDAFLIWRSILAHRAGDHFVAVFEAIVRYFNHVSAQNVEDLPTYDEANPPVVDISCLFELEYELREAEEVSNHDLQHFCFSTVGVQAWGYMREAMHTTTGRMGIPPYIAPLLRVPGITTGKW